MECTEGETWLMLMIEITVVIRLELFYHESWCKLFMDLNYVQSFISISFLSHLHWDKVDQWWRICEKSIQCL